MVLVEHTEGGCDDRLFDVGDPGPSVQPDQGGHHGESAAQCVLGQFAPGGAGESKGRCRGRTGVEHVEGALAPAERNHISSEGADEVDVVGFEVPEDERLDPEAAEPDGHAADQARLAQSGLAEHEHRRVGDQSGPGEPTDGVTTDRGVRAQITADRYADHRGA